MLEKIRLLSVYQLDIQDIIISSPDVFMIVPRIN